MKKKSPKLLYHGSAKKLIGKELIPKKAEDLDKRRIHNSLKAVYATDIKEEAMVMGILSCKGVKSSSLFCNNKDRAYGLIHTGWPKQEYFFVYNLPLKGFKEKPKNSHQWVSFKKVKPVKVEKFLVQKYSYLVRKATAKEKAKFFKTS